MSNPTERDVIMTHRNLAMYETNLSMFGAEVFARWLINHCERTNSSPQYIRTKWAKRFEKHEHLLHMDSESLKEYFEVLATPRFGTAACLNERELCVVGGVIDELRANGGPGA